MNLIPQPVAACDCSYNVIYVNEPFVKLVGRSSYEDCIGMDFGTLFQSKADFMTFKNLLREDKTVKNLEFRMFNTKGKEFISSISSSRHVDGKKTHMVCIINDITKKREIEAFSQLNNTIDKLVESNKYLADSLIKIKVNNG